MEAQQALQTIVNQVDFETGYPQREISYDQEMGFLTNGNRVVAFGSMPTTFTTMHPPETLDDLPPRKRTFMDNAKGIGYRVGNQPSALIQPLRHDEQLPIDAVEISGLTASQIIDVRRAGTVQHIAGYVRHLGLLVQSKVQGDQKALDRVARSYGSSAAVRMNIPPSWQDEQRLRGYRHVMPPEMLLLRSHKITIRRIGEVSLDKLTSKG